MKKSEMVSKLIEYHKLIIHSVGCKLSQTDYFNELLEMLEVEGMHPPLIDSETVIESDDSGNLFVKLWSWEEE